MSNKFYIKCDLFDKIEDLYRTGTNCITILPSEVIPEGQALTAPSDGIATDRMLERMDGLQ